MEGWMEDVLRRVPGRVRSSLRDFFLPFSAKSRSVGDLKRSEVQELFRIKQKDSSFDWYLQPHERRPVPDYLRSILRDYNLCMAGSPENEALVRTRLDAIFMTTLAAKKRQEWGPSASSSVDSISSYRSLHLQFETALQFPVTHKDRLVMVKGRADYSLWYKTADDPESNLVVVEAKANESDNTGQWQALTYMAMIHLARKKAGRSDTTIYGIATNSVRFIFMRIDNNSNWSSYEATWDEGNGAIKVISHLHKIMDHAAMLSPAASRQSSARGKRPLRSTGLEADPPKKAPRLSSISEVEPFDPFSDSARIPGDH